MTRTYNPKEVVVLFNGQRLTGFLDAEIKLAHDYTGIAGAMAAAADQPASTEFSVTLTGVGTDRDHKNLADAMDYLANNHATGRAISHHSGRGGSLIPDSAFRERRWNRPTSSGYVPRDEEDRDRERLNPGCYHKLPVRGDE